MTGSYLRLSPRRDDVSKEICLFEEYFTYTTVDNVTPTKIREFLRIVLCPLYFNVEYLLRLSLVTFLQAIGKTPELCNLLFLDTRFNNIFEQTKQ